MPHRRQGRAKTLRQDHLQLLRQPVGFLHLGRHGVRDGQPDEEGSPAARGRGSPGGAVPAGGDELLIKACEACCAEADAHDRLKSSSLSA